MNFDYSSNQGKVLAMIICHQKLKDCIFLELCDDLRERILGQSLLLCKAINFNHKTDDKTDISYIISFMMINAYIFLSDYDNYAHDSMIFSFIIPI